MSCLETAFSQVYQLAHAGKITLQTLVRKLTLEPSRVFGLPTGTLSPGAPADLALLDLEGTWAVDPNTFASKGKNTPIAGTTLPGKVAMTFVGGRPVYVAKDYAERGATQT
ncbi:MAG: amidohydrolase family protein [Chloroflexi bacterium]|nr:amidohydrolase family protein [Chloroflexota bacterium]